MKILLCALLAALFYILVVQAQIPRLCANEKSIRTRTCCPNITRFENSEPCGQDRGRGECVNTSTLCNQFSPEYDGDKVRDNWPHYFISACKCNENFGGVDCGECKFGWTGENCTDQESWSRSSITDIQSEWDEYRDTLREAKNANSTRYVVLTNDTAPGDANTVLTLVRNITVYDLFVWYHHYVAKENVASGKPCGGAHDYAHEKVGFLTWHRLFLLWFEREIRVELKKPNFKLYYWDWRAGAGLNELLQKGRFGEVGENGSVVEGFDNWTTVCWEIEATNSNCDPHKMDNMNTKLIRCPNKDLCSPTCTKWPSDEDVKKAVGMASFDSAPYNVSAEGGLRNYLEGYKKVACPEGKIKPFCDGECGERLLHNSVHLLLGHGEPEGVMANLAASPNDPLFLNHHTMIDCIFEGWFEKHLTEKYPSDVPNMDEYSGHKGDDCIVPFFPVYTHADMFKVASAFGYSCNLPNIYEDSTSQTPPSDQTTTEDRPSNTGQGSDGDDDDAASRDVLYSTITVIITLVVGLLL